MRGRLPKKRGYDRDLNIEELINTASFLFVVPYDDRIERDSVYSYLPYKKGANHLPLICGKQFGNEMIITLPSGKKKKTISRSTVDHAFEKALELGGKVSGSRALNTPILMPRTVKRLAIKRKQP